LIIVIVILRILAEVAIPRFAGLLKKQKKHLYLGILEH